MERKKTKVSIDFISLTLLDFFVTSSKRKRDGRREIEIEREKESDKGGGRPHIR